MAYKSIHTGQQIDAGVSAALNPDTTPTEGSDALITSGGAKAALDDKQNTLTFDSTPTAGSNNPITSDGIKSALTQVETDIASIHATGTTNTTGALIKAGTYFYLNGALVRAKEDIGTNTTFTNGTNYETVTAGGLNDLLKVEDIRSKITFNIGGARSAVRSGNIITINYRTGSSSVAADTVLFTVPTKYIPYILRNNLMSIDNTMYFPFASYDNGVSSCQIAAKTNGEFKVVGKAAPPYSGGNIVYMI